jgi:hypothetical protein
MKTKIEIDIRSALIGFAAGVLAVVVVISIWQIAHSGSYLGVLKGNLPESVRALTREQL